MSNGIVSLDDISSNGGSGTESETNDDSGAGDFAELREACEAIGADVENAIERVKSGDGTDEESLIEMARELADDDEMWAALEEYRAYNDQHRIKQNHLLDSDKEFTDWSGAFYGDTDNPDDGTYNAVQQRARDAGGNLYYYKALFPEPDAEHYPSDTAVLWQERPDEDSHIYVTAEFAEAYSDFTLEIDGKERPVPPWNGASGSSGGSDSSGDWPEAIQQAANAVGVDPSVIDADLEGYPAPNGLTIDSMKDLYDATDDYTMLSRALEIEKATKDRKGAKSYLEGRVERADEDPNNVASDNSGGKSNEAIAGEIAANTTVDLHPDTITEMLENDMTRDEIVDRFAE